MENVENQEKTKKTKKEIMDEFYKKNPDLKTKKFVCEQCGGEYHYYNKSKHIKTKLHKRIVERLKTFSA